jgi:hypothetical protein
MVEFVTVRPSDVVPVAYRPNCRGHKPNTIPHYNSTKFTKDLKEKEDVRNSILRFIKATYTTG